MAAAYEVFNLGSKSIDLKGIHLRRSVQHIDSKTNVWARILPREWKMVVRPHIDEVAIFLEKDDHKWGSTKDEEKVIPLGLALYDQHLITSQNLDGSGPSVDHPRLLHLVGINSDGGQTNNDPDFVVPMPESYEVSCS